MDMRQRIWNLMGPERRLAAAQAFWASPQHKDAHRQVEALLAQRLHARPVFVRRLTDDRKAAYLSRDMALNPYLWDAVMVAYQFAAHRDMLVEFLNAAGVPNKDGHYEVSGDMQPPSAEALETGVHALLDSGKYDKLDVVIYLGAVLIQDETFWTNLRPVFERLEKEVGASGERAS